MTTNRDNILVGRVEFGQPVAQAPDKRVQRLIRNSYGLLFAPNGFYDLRSGNNLPELMKTALRLLRDWSGCEAVAH